MVRDWPRNEVSEESMVGSGKIQKVMLRDKWVAGDFDS